MNVCVWTHAIESVYTSLQEAKQMQSMCTIHTHARAWACMGMAIGTGMGIGMQALCAKLCIKPLRLNLVAPYLDSRGVLPSTQGRVLDVFLNCMYSREERATVLPEAFTPPGLELEDGSGRVCTSPRVGRHGPTNCSIFLHTARRSTSYAVAVVT